MGTAEGVAYLPESSVTVHATVPGSRPHVEIENRICLLHGRFRRCFPLTMADEYISLHDASGAEIGILKDLSKMDAASRENIAEELDAFYFTPALASIVSLKAEASMWKWEVETQRGEVTFYLRGVRDSVHEVAPNRWQIYSVDGQRYEIRDLNELDQRSQNLFEGLF